MLTMGIFSMDPYTLHIGPGSYSYHQHTTYPVQRTSYVPISQYIGLLTGLCIGFLISLYINKEISLSMWLLISLPIDLLINELVCILISLYLSILVSLS